LAKEMGGDVTVTSSPKRGSTFRLTVVVEPVQPDHTTAAPPGATARATNLTLLCAEDNPYGRVILNTILTELGHRVDFVGTGEAAIDAVAAGSHDMVLMDVTLPGIDGIEATRRIRALAGAVSGIPIIGISGNSAPDHETAASAAPADANGELAKAISSSPVLGSILWASMKGSSPPMGGAEPSAMPPSPSCGCVTISTRISWAVTASRSCCIIDSNRWNDSDL